MLPMEIIDLHKIEREEGVSSPLSVTLGNFDGVHIGHRALLSAAGRMQEECLPHAKRGVLCFSPPSSDFLAELPPKHLCSDEEKAERFAAAGMDFVLFADFLKLRNLSPEEFIGEILIKQCHCVGIVCGFNYRFGKGGAGTPQLLQSMQDFPVFVQAEIADDGEAVSSSRIRRLIQEGKVEKAAHLLTLPYSFTAPVLHGKALGRRWGTPTINQQLPLWAQIPHFGVYVTECLVDGDLVNIAHEGCKGHHFKPTSLYKCPEGRYPGHTLQAQNELREQLKKEDPCYECPGHDYLHLDDCKECDHYERRKEKAKEEE